MKLQVTEACSDEERTAIYRLRYDIYVQEMGRYQSIADHERRWLVEEVDGDSRLFLARDGDQVVGERFMVLPDYRGSDLTMRFFEAQNRFANERRVQLCFGDDDDWREVHRTLSLL
ncbi:MAG: hypothetical protein VYE73_09365, partial [Acidobacteriota bacterium]|nr:hypothetical protein [Acidobacteriota bacterium]